MGHKIWSEMLQNISLQHLSDLIILFCVVGWQRVQLRSELMSISRSNESPFCFICLANCADVVKSWKYHDVIYDILQYKKHKLWFAFVCKTKCVMPDSRQIITGLPLLGEMPREEKGEQKGEDVWQRGGIGLSGLVHFSSRDQYTLLETCNSDKRKLCNICVPDVRRIRQMLFR